jgi:uncharacterized membrane protein YhhN
MIGAALVAAGTAAAAVWEWRHVARPEPVPLTGALLKAGAVAALAVAGLVLGAPAAVVAGLALGAAGDFALARPGDRWFLAGMALFAAGHLAYAAAFLGLGAGWPGWPVLLALGLLAGSTEVWLSPRTGALRWPVRGYVVLIVAMAALAAALPAGRGWLVLGAALFVASDLMLAVERFVLAARPAEDPLRRLLALALWPAYWGGQALILAGSL